MSGQIYLNEEVSPGFFGRFPLWMRKANSVLVSVVIHSLVLISFSVTSLYLCHAEKKEHVIKLKKEKEQPKQFEEEDIVIPRVKEMREFSEDPGSLAELLLEKIEVREKAVLREMEELDENEVPRSESMDDIARKMETPSELYSALDLNAFAERARKYALANPLPDEPQLGSASAFFGSRVGSKRVIFIIDVSGSMREAGTFRNYSGRGNINCSKIDIAKKELIKCVKGMDPRTKFNILAYSDTVEKPFAKMRTATGKNIRAAVRFVNRLSPSGGTDTRKAFAEAFRETEADTVFLLSDGLPTTGTVTANNTGNLSTTQIHMKGTFQEITRANHRRKLNIHTFGFEDACSGSGGGTKPAAPSAEARFMKELAEYNRGRYTSVK